MTATNHVQATGQMASRRGVLERIGNRVGVHNISLIAALIILCVIFGSLRGDVFFSSRNILNIGLAVTILGVLAMSQTVVIVAGGLVLRAAMRALGVKEVVVSDRGLRWGLLADRFGKAKSK